MDLSLLPIKGTAMKTFNDYSELEKANLTEVEVQTLLKYELMDLGIIAPQKPELLPEEDPVLEEKVYYRPSLKDYSSLDCVFATSKEAEQFMSLKPLIFDHGYPSYRNNVAEPEEVKIEAIKAISKVDYESSKGLIEGAASNKTRNKEATQKYEDDMQAASNATNFIWTEWTQCRNKKSEAERLIGVYDQYLEDCDGDKKIALRFLGKAFSQDEIKDAYDLLEIACPIAEVEEVEI